MILMITNLFKHRSVEEYIHYMSLMQHEKRVKGLSGIRHLSKSEGMFFKHDKMGCRSYTMENTHIPLRIIFINDNFNVVNEFNAKPYQKEEVNPEVDFMYVIEILGR